MADSRKGLYWTLRILISVVFIISAIAKLLAIDQFELYVYSYLFFSFNTSSVLVRLCIAFELFLGIMLLIGSFKRLTSYAILLLLVFFSLFLCYALLIGRNESCQCFGRLIEVPPQWSLVKNAVLIILVLFLMRTTHTKEALPSTLLRHSFDIPSTFLRRIVVAALIFILSNAAVFTLSAPDSWLFSDKEEPFNEKILTSAIEESPLLQSFNLYEDNHLVAFITPGCIYCKMTKEKMSSMISRHNLDTTFIHYIEPSDIGPRLFMDITYGRRPLVLLLEQGNVVRHYHYRNINEKQISKLLPSNNNK